MIYIALKMLVGDRLKYLSLVAGLSFAALLVTQQASIFAGYALRTGAWVRDTNQFDLWVMDSQSEFTESNMQMLDSALPRVRGVGGVAWAVPMYKSYLTARLPDGRLQTVRLIGLDDASMIGGPPTFTHNSLASLREDRSIVINAEDAGDQLLVNRGTPAARPLVPGDVIAINEHEARVVGLYQKSPEFFWEPVIYTTYTRALLMAPPERRQLSFVLVKVSDGRDVAAVQAAITEATGLKVWTADEFESATMKYVLDKTGILINFGMTIALGFVIGVLVSGQTLFTFVHDNLRYFAALKAMGAGSWMLVRMVFMQVLAVGGIGYGVGLGAAALTGLGFARVGLAFEMHWTIPIAGAMAILVCCCTAAAISLRRVLTLEPAVVFKS
ncbi:MAG TPA: ABC transporter permease [Tepidisphaeraceae bacterium]|jgi:putative ABC transport system permease protein